MPLLAQQHQFMRGNCMPDSETADSGGPAASRAMRHLPTPKTVWDPERIYPVAVVLVEASDTTFTIENPNVFYNSLFNERGFNQGNGMGCVADYFRDQSYGLLNLEFHVYGPVKVSYPMRNSEQYGGSSFREAMRQVITDYPYVDYTLYDWDGNGAVEQVVFVYAGFGGNETAAKAKGCIWPNTGSFGTVTTPDGVRISNYTASAELWSANSKSCGIGTICHEFSHSLGLPDIYPTSSNAGYSVVDEWDLMDGGNFVNYGWCPPNYTPIEKMRLGWLTPTELTEPASIRNLKPSAEGGEIYRISHSTSEWLLLENRQQQGWDLGVPGQGLVIYHVNYDLAVWQGNSVNNDKNKRRFQLVNADNLDYDGWDELIGNVYPYKNPNRMNSRYLSTSPYPWSTDSTSFVNNELTDTSVPAATMYYPNEEGGMLLGKPITNISLSDDGLISFDFCGGDLSAINDIKHSPLTTHPSPRYDLLGRRVNGRPAKGIYIVEGKKVVIH